MVDSQPENYVKSDESLVRQMESQSNSTKIIGKVEEACNGELKKKTKRKKSTSIEGIGVENETIGIEYAIVQHENKRQKIEIHKNQNIGPKSGKAEGSSADKSTAKQVKDAKNTAETSKLRLKFDNIHANTVQKLNAQAEQLRMEISTLRTALANEQSAVRVLR